MTKTHLHYYPIRYILAVVVLLTATSVWPVKGQTVAPADQICGKWMVAEKNLEVEVYKENGDFKSKIIWFKSDEPTKPMEEWTDIHNPDKSLRSRKLLGMSVVRNLVYEPKSNSWEHGDIYDAKNGHYWDASAYLTKEGLLKVTGYWHFKFIGRTLTFKKVV